MKIRAIITGVTGMVGEGVLHECLLHPDVEKILVITRRPSEIVHPKLTEIIHGDFSDFSAIENQLTGYNAAYLIMGVSSVGMNEEKYRYLTYDLTIALARPLSRLNPEMTLCYVSGSGTDNTEHGRVMWARVKGKTENDLMRLPFRQTFMFRPAFMQPTEGLKNTLKLYKYLSPLFPVVKTVFPKYVCSLAEVGKAMINSVNFGYPKSVLEVPDIIELAGK